MNQPNSARDGWLAMQQQQQGYGGLYGNLGGLMGLSQSGNASNQVYLSGQVYLGSSDVAPPVVSEPDEFAWLRKRVNDTLWKGK